MKFSHALLSLFLLHSMDAMAQNWTVGGNNLTGNGRIGTNTDVDVIFETSNTARGRVTRTGLWGFGVTTPAARVHVGGTGIPPLRVDIGANTALLVGINGGTTIGGTEEATTFGLLVSGSAGIGDYPGAYQMKVQHSAAGLDIENANTLDDWELWSGPFGLELDSNSAFVGLFNRTSGSYSSVSDEKTKTNIQAMPPVLEQIKRLQPSTYQFQHDGLMADADLSYGFVAQDVASVFPHLVTHLYEPERGLDTYTMDYAGFGVLAIKAIQELEARIAELEKELSRNR